MFSSPISPLDTDTSLAFGSYFVCCRRHEILENFVQTVGFSFILSRLSNFSINQSSRSRNKNFSSIFRLYHRWCLQFSCHSTNIGIKLPQSPIVLHDRKLDDTKRCSPSQKLLLLLQLK